MTSTRLHLEILPQPDDSTCGATCLHAVYRYHGDELELGQVIEEVPQLPGGGTLAVFLANHALRRGYRATLYTYDLQLFDPTWFVDGEPIPAIRDKLLAQVEAKSSPKLHPATGAFLELLERGGSLRLGEATPSLISSHLDRELPLLTGLSATYLYQSAREVDGDPGYDDVRGEPSGHFVVLSGYDDGRREVLVADPLYPNPLAPEHIYAMPLGRVISSILLGILTHDSNILVIEPPGSKKQ